MNDLNNLGIRKSSDEVIEISRTASPSIDSV
jgi:hypothetical protein